MANQHFVNDSEELPYYALHEVHHVGFLRRRPMPELTELDDGATLRTLIEFLTQMEGMAVHAAFALRARDGRLSSDADYRVYSDEARAHQIIGRYREVLELVPVEGAVKASVVGAVLEAMSSGERLWYRFGALAARELERVRGAEALQSSVDEPALFQQVCRRLLDGARAP